MFSSLFLLLSSPFSFVVALVVVLVIVVVVEFLLILFLLPLSNKNELLLLLLLLLFPYDVDAVNEESARMMLEAMVDASRRARERKTQSEEGKKMRARLAVFKKNEEFVKEKNKEKNLHFFFGFCGSCVYSELTVVVTTRVG
jgi:hypothetical protein